MDNVSEQQKEARQQQAGELVLWCPDFQAAEKELGLDLPFILWQVGDQPLLAHWLDYALNRGASKVRMFTENRPDLVRAWLEANPLWRLPWDVIPQKAPEESDAQVMDYLPWITDPTRSTASHPFTGETGWELLEHRQVLDEDWLEHILPHNTITEANLAIGRGCRIAPSAKVHMPSWIGEYVRIGPGCEIGPHALIENGCFLQGQSRVTHSRMAAHTYLGTGTELERVWLKGNELFNLKNRARVNLVDQFLARDMQEAPSREVPAKDRLLALWLQARIRPGAPREKLQTFQGQGLTLSEGPTPLHQRARWLKEVVAGRLQLFGVLPRTEQQLRELPEDWQEILRQAEPGFFSYADIQGCHLADDPEEALHAVYQATQPPRAMREILRPALTNLPPKIIPIS